jgi:uncharacterized protein with LGFP repeats
LSAIDDKYAQLGGPGGFLGSPVDAGAGSGEMDTATGRGRVRDFEGGSIYFSQATGAHEIHGDIRVKYGQRGGERSLGLPVTDELGCPDGRGRFNHFEGGSIYWTPQTGAHDVRGPIRDKWSELGFERSRLGYPTSDQRKHGEVRSNEFEGGAIVFTPGQGVDVRTRTD